MDIFGAICFGTPNSTQIYTNFYIFLNFLFQLFPALRAK